MKTIVANWKMNGAAAAGLELAEACARHMRPGIGAEVVICPPFTLLAGIGEIISSPTRGGSIALGAQDCSSHEPGAYTGDISASQLADVGCTYVIVGHSERRQHHAETNELVAKKAEAAIKAGLKPIVCVGESLAEREFGTYLAAIEKQVKESIPFSRVSTLIAYEPVWAIGSGKTPTLAEIAEVHKHIAKSLGGGITPPILYGGSVKAANAREILHTEGVDGVLVGGASLKAVEFCAIIDGAA